MSRKVLIIGGAAVALVVAGAVAAPKDADDPGTASAAPGPTPTTTAAAVATTAPPPTTTLPDLDPMTIGMMVLEADYPEYDDWQHEQLITDLGGVACEMFAEGMSFDDVLYAAATAAIGEGLNDREVDYFGSAMGAGVVVFCPDEAWRLDG
jgi:hypothetical protein